MKVLKCPSCSASIDVDAKLSVCSYCGSKLFRESAASEEQDQSLENELPCQSDSKIAIPSRPKISIGSMIWLCILYIFPGIIYYNSIKNKQKQWDALYEKYHLDRPSYPQLDKGLMVLLCILYIFPGIIYYNSIKKKQALWNESYLIVNT